MKDIEKLALLKELDEHQAASKQDELGALNPQVSSNKGATKSDKLAFFNQHYLASFEKLTHIKHSVSFTMLAIALLLGLVLTPSTFSTVNDNQLNVFWLLLILLGANTLSLVIWVLITVLQPSKRRNWEHVSRMTLSSFAALSKTRPAHVETYKSLYLQSSRGKWFASHLMHAAWTCYLIGGLISMTVYLMTHEVQFIWETTLLSHTSFQNMTHVLGVIPNLLGISVPNNADVILSSLSNTIRLPELQQKWSYLVISSIVIYGIFPRLILAIYSRVHYTFLLNKAIKQRCEESSSLTQEEHESQILDPDPIKAPKASLNPTEGLVLATSNDLQKPVYGFEWLTDVFNGIVINTINNRDEQKRFLSESRELEAVTILVNAKSSPDRGSARFLESALIEVPNMKLIIVGDHYLNQWISMSQEIPISIDSIRHWPLSEDNNDGD